MAEAASEQDLRTPAAFAAMYARHSDELLRYFYRRTADPEVEADLCAETFASALEKADKFDAALGSQAQWLYGIAHHQLAKFWRRKMVARRARRRYGIPSETLDDATAAHLQHAAETGPPRNTKQIPLALAVVVLAVGLASGLVRSLVTSDPSYAEGLTITIGDEAFEVEVHAPIADLSVPLRQLREVGVAVEAVEEPTPDGLIGHITSLYVIRGEVEWEPAGVSQDGSVNRFTVREGEQLVLYVGRKAKPGEVYESTEPPEDCARWRDRPVNEVRADIETTLGSLRWKLFDGRVVTEITEPEPDHLVQRAFPLSATSGLVFVSPMSDALPAHAHCAPDP